jgi:hypothetical protein
MSIQAGVDGLGVILDSTTLAASELAAGRLVIPFAGRTKNLEVTGHYLVYPRATHRGRSCASSLHGFARAPRSSDRPLRLHPSGTLLATARPAGRQPCVGDRFGQALFQIP